MISHTKGTPLRVTSERPPLVRDLMSVAPITIGADEPLSRADRLMREREISGMPVINTADELVGVVSRTDLGRVAADARIAAWPGLPVRSTMTSPALTIPADATLAQAAALMEERRVHRLVVTDPDTDQPIGIFSTTDLVRAVARGR
jgi:CBS domain-containing protein